MDFLNLENALSISPVSAICAILFILLSILYFNLQSKISGPWGLPYLGFWPFLKNETVHLQLEKFMKKYGEVYSFKYAGKLYIHLGTIKCVKEAFVTKSDCFTDRFPGFSMINAIFKEGVATVNGESWRTLRKFFMNSFRELGMSSVKDYMSGPILDSVNATVDDLRAKDGAPVEIISILTIRSSAILRRVLFNDDGITEEELKEILKEYEKVILTFTNISSLTNGEFARYFIFPFNKIYKVASESQEKVFSILRNVIRRHEASFDKDNVRDIIDSYIKERNERRSRGDPTSEYFTENALIGSIDQFVGDGILSVAIFIAYFVNALLEHPEEQDKMYKELEEVVGPGRQPTLQDKTKLPYLNAFIQEVQRMMDFFNIFVNVECSKETTVHGHTVPKGALMLMNLWTCHRDPNTFDEPHEFRPSRYIAEPGRQKAEAPIMFGIGKRSCIGEPFVLMQIFLFLAIIIKNFRLTRPEGTTKKAFPDIEMEICAHPRK